MVTIDWYTLVLTVLVVFAIGVATGIITTKTKLWKK